MNQELLRKVLVLASDFIKDLRSWLGFATKATMLISQIINAMDSFQLISARAYWEVSKSHTQGMLQAAVISG